MSIRKKEFEHLALQRITSDLPLQIGMDALYPNYEICSYMHTKSTGNRKQKAATDPRPGTVGM